MKNQKCNHSWVFVGMLLVFSHVFKKVWYSIHQQQCGRKSMISVVLVKYLDDFYNYMLK